MAQGGTLKAIVQYAEDELQEIIDLKREEAEILGYEDHPYDAMLNLYEPNAKTKVLEILFKDPATPKEMPSLKYLDTEIDDTEGKMFQ